MIDAPLPRWINGSLVLALLVVGGAAALMILAMPTLRQGRLIEEAERVCRIRQGEAIQWLEREPEVVAGLTTEREAAADRGAHLLQADDEVGVRATLEALAEESGFEVLTFRLGTARRGEAFDTVPATLQFAGDRVELSPLLEAFYSQPRVVRLVALDLESPEFGSQRAVVTLRWEFAAPVRVRPLPSDPSVRFAPPAIVSRESAGAVASWNQGRWEALEEATDDLGSLGPDLRRLARLEAERTALEQERRSMARWREASTSEQGAVLRKVPQLLRRLDVSAVGRAGLRPGPGGTLQLIDDD